MPSDDLTPRQLEVARLVADDLTNREIAERLSISLETVKQHVSAAMARLGARRREALGDWYHASHRSGARRLRGVLAAPLSLALLGGGAVAVAATVVIAVAVLGGTGEPEEPPLQVGATAGAPETATAPPEPSPPAAPPRTACTSGDEAAPRTPPAAAGSTAADPATPYAVSFARGEPIDVSPAVVFVDAESCQATAWVFPGAIGEFGVPPSGAYIVYRVTDGFRLLRTDDGSDRAIIATSLPIEYGPGDSGFIATTQDRFVVSRFDGRGEHRADLWLGGVNRRTAVEWAGDGSAVAWSLGPGSDARLHLTIRPVSDGGPEYAIDLGVSRGAPSLEWPGDGRWIAVVTSDFVRVFNRDGELMWDFAGQFYGNPRWSPDASHLYVNAMPGPDIGYLFTADGEALFRVLVSEASGCGGDPWLVDGSGIEFGQWTVSVEGEIEPLLTRSRSLYPELAVYEVELAPSVDGFHIPHYASGRTSDHVDLTDDRRLVFTTPEIGHGGCAGALGGWPPGAPQVQRPPYESLGFSLP